MWRSEKTPNVYLFYSSKLHASSKTQTTVLVLRKMSDCISANSFFNSEFDIHIDIEHKFRFIIEYLNIFINCNVFLL